MVSYLTEDFEDFPTGWTTSEAGTATITKDGTHAHGGSWACKVSVPDAANSAYAYKNMTEAPGNYHVKLWIFPDDDVLATHELVIRLWDTSGAAAALFIFLDYDGGVFYIENGTAHDTFEVVSAINNEAWTEVDVYVDVVANTATYLINGVDAGNFTPADNTQDPDLVHIGDVGYGSPARDGLYWLDDLDIDDEAQLISDSAELFGKGEIRQPASMELLANADIRQPGSAELLAKFEIQDSNELLGKFDVHTNPIAQDLNTWTEYDPQAELDHDSNDSWWSDVPRLRENTSLTADARLRSNFIHEFVLNMYEVIASGNGANERICAWAASTSLANQNFYDIPDFQIAALIVMATDIADEYQLKLIEKGGNEVTMATKWINYQDRYIVIYKEGNKLNVSIWQNAEHTVGEDSGEITLSGDIQYRYISMPMTYGQAGAETSTGYIDPIFGSMEFLLANAEIRHPDSAELLARFEVGQDSAELLANAEIRHPASVELLANAEIRQPGSTELLANAEIRHPASAELLANVEIRHPISTELLSKAEIRHPGSAELLANAEIRHPASVEFLANAGIRHPGSAELFGKAEVRHPGSVELLANAEIRQPGSVELLANAEIRQPGSVELLANAEIRQPGSTELLANAEIRQPGSAELFGKAEIRHTGTPVELLANTEIRHPGSAELLANAEIRHSASIDLLGKSVIRHDGIPIELLGRCIIRHDGIPIELLGKSVIRHDGIPVELPCKCVIRHDGIPVELFAKTDIVHWIDLSARTVIRHSTYRELSAQFWVRWPTRLWTNRRYINGVIELPEKLIGDARLEYVIEGVMEDIQGYLDNNDLTYDEWTDITLIPVQILRAVTYGTVAALYARHTQTFEAEVIPSITPVTVTVLGDAEKAMNYWTDRMMEMLTYYVSYMSGPILESSTEDEEPIFSMEDIPEEITEYVSWYEWLMRRES